MEQIFDIQVPTEKIIKKEQFGVGTFLSGPLVAGYTLQLMLKSCSKVLNDLNKRRSHS